MKGVVEDRVSIELLPGIPLGPQIQPRVVPPGAGAGLSEAGSCLVISVSLTVFLPPRLFSGTVVCSISDVAAVVKCVVVLRTSAVVGLCHVCFWIVVACYTVSVRDVATLSILSIVFLVCVIVGVAVNLCWVDVWDVAGHADHVAVVATHLLLQDMSIFVLVCVIVYLGVVVIVVLC